LCAVLEREWFVSGQCVELRNVTDFLVSFGDGNVDFAIVVNRVHNFVVLHNLYCFNWFVNDFCFNFLIAKIGKLFELAKFIFNLFYFLF